MAKQLAPTPAPISPSTNAPDAASVPTAPNNFFAHSICLSLILVIQQFFPRKA